MLGIIWPARRCGQARHPAVNDADPSYFGQEAQTRTAGIVDRPRRLPDARVNGVHDRVGGGPK